MALTGTWRTRTLMTTLYVEMSQASPSSRILSESRSARSASPPAMQACMAVR